MAEAKRILLIDLDDLRRSTRVELLERAGYEVDLRTDFLTAEAFDHEGEYDLVILALHTHPQLAAEYTDRLTGYKPGLPILLLLDNGVYAPKGTLSQDIESGNPGELMTRIASMLAGSTYIRELAKPTSVSRKHDFPPHYRDDFK